MTENAYFTTLPGRGMIKITGPDAKSFLQNLVTNNMDRIEKDGVIYACLLSPQGKFLHDFFISPTDDGYLLDCEGGERTQDLVKRLSLYKLRADVEITSRDNAEIYAIVSPHMEPEDDNVVFYPDPRHAEMGYRILRKPDDLPEKPFDIWDTHRIHLTIPDGSRDLVPNSSTMDEGRMDQFSAIDYEKGCYIGQELTARMHYRGLGKKHLYTVEGHDLPEPGEPIIYNGKVVGEMRSRCGLVGLALLKENYSGEHPFLPEKI